jgi:hypothetical protein
MAQYGHAQWQHQHLVGTDPSHYNFDMHTTYPQAFIVNNFYEDSVLYMGTRTGTPPNMIPGYSNHGTFTKVKADNAFSGEYDWNQKQQDDTLSNVQYLPIKTMLKFRFKCKNLGPSLPRINVRVTIFKFKRGIAQTNVHAQLPTTLGAYHNMCYYDVRSRNHFNTHEFHTILYDKWLSFAQTDVTKNDVEKNLFIKWQFYGRRSLELDVAPGSTWQETDFVDSINRMDQLWCLISTDNNATDRVSFQLERWNHWRDNHGVGN